MPAVTVHLPDDELAFVDGAAARETRSRSVQIRHYIREAMRRAGGGNGASPPGDNPSGNPPLPVVNPKNIDQVRAELAELEAERDRLAAAQDKLGFRFLPEDDARLRFLYSRCGAIRSHIQVIERFMGARS
jgi:Ribbon-helix-helix protein, copG family